MYIYIYLPTVKPRSSPLRSHPFTHFIPGAPKLASPCTETADRIPRISRATCSFGARKKPPGPPIRTPRMGRGGAEGGQNHFVQNTLKKAETNTMGITNAINHPFGNGSLYQLSMVMTGEWFIIELQGPR